MKRRHKIQYVGYLWTCWPPAFWEGTAGLCCPLTRVTVVVAGSWPAWHSGCQWRTCPWWTWRAVWPGPQPTARSRRPWRRPQTGPWRVCWATPKTRYTQREQVITLMWCQLLIIITVLLHSMLEFGILHISYIKMKQIQLTHYYKFGLQKIRILSYIYSFRVRGLGMKIICDNNEYRMKIQYCIHPFSKWSPHRTVFIRNHIPGARYNSTTLGFRSGSMYLRILLNYFHLGAWLMEFLVHVLGCVLWLHRWHSLLHLWCWGRDLFERQLCQADFLVSSLIRLLWSGSH